MEETANNALGWRIIMEKKTPQLGIQFKLITRDFLKKDEAEQYT